MASKKKTWLEKFESSKNPQVKTVEKDLADIPAHSQMLIASPKVFEEYIRNIPSGHVVDLKTIRNDLALDHNAEYTCPVTTGIYLRVVAESNYERLTQGEGEEAIAPFWRAIDPQSNLAQKLSFGTEFIRKKQEEEKDQ
ncbi:MAG: hypothetical protein AAF363_01130 [Bacteroidota bacterium]